MLAPVSTAPLTKNMFTRDFNLWLEVFSQFGDGYSTLRKEPDICIQPVGMTLPTIILESG